MNIKEKVVYIVNTMDMDDEHDTEFSYFKELMENVFANDTDLPIIRKKMDSLVDLCYKKRTEGDEAFEKLLDMDFEEEIWEMI